MRRSFLALLILLPGLAMAAVFEQPLGNPAQETRARMLFAQLRCVVCESASLADSPADVARDMRTAIRSEIANGKSDEEIIAWLTERYGSAIRMSPEFTPRHYLIWFAPGLLLLAGAIAAALYFRRQR